MRRSFAVQLAAAGSLLALAACGGGSSSRATTVPGSATSPSTTAAPIATDATAPGVPDAITVTGEDGSVWSLQLDGYLHGVNTTGRTDQPCVTVVGSMTLVDAPDGWSGLAADAAIEVIAGDKTVKYKPFVRCDLDEPASLSAFFALVGDMLPGASRDFVANFVITEKVVDAAPVLRLHNSVDEVRVDLAPLTALPQARPVEIGAVTAPLEPVGTTTEWRDGEVGALYEITVAGVQMVQSADGWCVVVYAWATLPDGGGRLRQRPRLMADGWAAGDDVVGPAGDCLPPTADAFWRTLTSEPVDPGGSVSLAIQVEFTERPTLQAILQPQGEGPDLEWVWVGPVLVDSPPPRPS